VTGEHRPAGRRPGRAALALAIGLDAIVAVGVIVALANGAPVFVVAVAVILAIAPWAAIIDEQERPRRG
jgi:hypothetical protein